MGQLFAGRWGSSKRFHRLLATAAVQPAQKVAGAVENVALRTRLTSATFLSLLRYNQSLMFNGSRWLWTARRWAWDNRSPQLGSGRRRRWPFLAVPAAVLLSVFLVVGFSAYAIALNNPQPLASIGGCPSTAVPLPPGSSQEDVSGLGFVLPPQSVGCWQTYSENLSPDALFVYYTDGSHTSGWNLVYAYPATRDIRLASTNRKGLQANIWVLDKRDAPIGRSGTQLQITVCFCDPDLFRG